MAFHTITIEDSAVSFRCPDTRSVLDGMDCLGRKGIPVGCKGGGCGVCKVQVVAGTYEASVMSTAHISQEDLAAGRVLACKVKPTSDLIVRVLGSMRKQFSSPVLNVEETQSWR
jgi:ferredoxin